MIQEESEKIAFCAVCLESLTTDLYFTSDDYLYHKKCFNKSNFKSAISRNDFLYYFRVNKVVNDKVYFEKNIKNIFRINYDLDGFDEHGFNRKWFDRNGFISKGIDEYGYDRIKELACKEKHKQAIIEAPNNYQYANLRLKHNVDLAEYFPEQGGSFSRISKHLRKNKKIVMVAVEKNPESFQYIGKNLKTMMIYSN